MLTVSVSDILLYQECPAKWAATQVAKRRPIKDTKPALSIGSAFHEVMEEMLDNSLPSQMEGFEPIDFEKAMVDRVAKDWNSKGIPLEDKPWDKVLDQASKLSFPTAHFFTQGSPFDEIFGTEHAEICEMKVKHRGQWVTFYLRTKMDVIVESKGGLWHCQYKTHAEKNGDDTENFVSSIRHSLHEAAYRHAIGQFAQKKGIDLPYMGTMLFVFLKSPIHRKAKGEKCSHCDKGGLVLKNPATKIHPADLLITPQRVNQVMDTIASTVLKMEEDLKYLPSWNTHENEAPPVAQHTGSCYHMNYGLCPYMEVCRGDLAIDNPLTFQSFDPHERYKEN